MDNLNVSLPPAAKSITFVAPGKSAPPPVSVTITPEMIAAVHLPDAIDLLDRLILEARGRAQQPDLYEGPDERRARLHRSDAHDLTVLLAVRGRLDADLQAAQLPAPQA